MAELREGYKDYVAKLFKLAGMSDPQARADRVFALEMKIAAAQTDIITAQDAHKGDNPWKRADFAAKAPGIDWNALLDRGGAPQAAGLHRLEPRDHDQARRARRERADGDVAGLAGVPPDQPEHVGAAQGVRRRVVRFLRQAVERHRRRSAPRDKRSIARGQRRARRCGRQDLCRQIFPGLVEGGDQHDGQEHRRRVRPPHRRARLDGARDQGRGAQEAGGAEGRRRLSRQVARIPLLRGQRERPAGQFAARADCPIIATRSARSARRPIAASGG